MDHCATVLLSFPPSGETAASLADKVFDSQMKSHISHITKLYKGSAALLAAHAIDLLDCLDPAIHTYSYLTLLDTILPVEAALYEAAEPIVADKLVTFFARFDPRQVRYAGSAFTHLFSAVGSGKIIPASVAVPLLAQALSAVDPSGCMLTSHHLVLAKLAYHTNHVAAALDVLGHDIIFFPGAIPHSDADYYLCSRSLPPPSYISKDTGLTLPLRSSQVLEFDHLLGLMYCSVRDWPAAHAAFGRVASYPTRDLGASKIMVEAHKKWILTGLLLYGKVAAAPPNTAAYTGKLYAATNKLYVQIAEHFASPSAEAIVAEVSLAGDAFANDGNASLVQEVLAAHAKWQIAHLRNVYVRVSMAAIRKAIEGSATASPAAEAAQKSDAGTEALVQDMIDTKMIAAVIRRPDGAETEETKGIKETEASRSYLEFLPETNEMTETEFSQKMAVAVERIRLLMPMYKTTNEHLSLNRDYLRQVIRDLKRDKEQAERDALSAGGSGIGPAAESLYYEADPDDEDLMTELSGP